MTPRPRGHSFNRAFSMIELLVVVAVIVLLVGILIPAMWKARSISVKNTAIAQLNTIRMGLQAYYTDFNIYPPSTSTGNYGGIQANRGQAMLAQGLMGYLPSNIDGAGPPNAGEPSYGFRTRRGSMGGQIYGPYVSADTKGLKINNGTGTDQSFIDPWGNEILYYRSNLSVPGATLTPNGAKIFDKAANNSGANGIYQSIFNDDDCNKSLNPTPTPTAAQMDPNTTATQTFWNLIGAVGPNGSNIISRNIVGYDSFLLLSAGADGQYFGTDTKGNNQETDDLVSGKQ